MIISAFMQVYRVLWALLLPIVLLYLWKRGRKDARYTQHLAERFGFYTSSLPQNPIWFHAVSLGEIRSAVALIRLALARGDTVVVTNFTPAGRIESERQFAAEIASGQLAVVWVPFDMGWCYRRFFRACKPRIALMLEVEIWPAMVFATKRAKIPLYLCNAQYASYPIARDSKGLRLRQRVIRNCAGGFVKSDLQAQRFRAVGLQNLTVTGELRFDQPIPPHQTAAARALRPPLVAKNRDVIAIASGVAEEEPLYAELIKSVRKRAVQENRPKPLFVYVPRAPERFTPVAQALVSDGLAVLRRSQALAAGAGLDALQSDADFAKALGAADVFLGDSLGEMYFYLALADRVIVGGGYTAKGAHNIIEPLCLNKPVLVGPSTWTIEFPFVEAEAAGVVQQCDDLAGLQAALAAPPEGDEAQIKGFVAQHIGASRRTLAAIDAVLAQS